MDVIESENLQQNALDVGEYLLQEGIKIGYNFEMIGDVRGRGLFIGFEIVKSKSCRTPATQEAQWIVDRMKSVHRVLISSDGPHENVLKLKPPMVFTKENADEFFVAFKECMHFLQKVSVSMNFRTNRIISWWISLKKTGTFDTRRHSKRTGYSQRYSNQSDVTIYELDVDEIDLIHDIY